MYVYVLYVLCESTNEVVENYLEVLLTFPFFKTSSWIAVSITPQRYGASYPWAGWAENVVQTHEASQAGAHETALCYNHFWYIF